jgi:hypothetical protein
MAGGAEHSPAPGTAGPWRVRAEHAYGQNWLQQKLYFQVFHGAGSTSCLKTRLDKAGHMVYKPSQRAGQIFRPGLVRHRTSAATGHFYFENAL